MFYSLSYFYASQITNEVQQTKTAVFQATPAGQSVGMMVYGRLQVSSLQQVVNNIPYSNTELLTLT